MSQSEELDKWAEWLLHLFSAAEGGPIRKTFGRREFKPAAKASDLLPLRVHDLRHTAAGLMMRLGLTRK